MANEIYHRSNWGNAVNDKYWADVYEKYSATNKMYIRSDYYENSNVTDKLMADIYPKPSILLTPTAYDNGSLHSVKPVQTFGNELVTNGTFDTDSDWTKTQATISNGEATITSPDGSYAAIYQDNVATIGKTYKCSINVVSISGTMQLRLGSGTDQDITTIGTKIFYIKAFSSTLEIKRKSGAGALDVTIDNVSVKEVTDADFDFTRGSSATRVNEKGLIEDVQILSGNLVQNGDFSQIGSEEVTNGDFDTDSDWSKFNGATISDGKANIIGDGSSFTNLSQSNVFTVGKFYKVTLDAVINSGLGLKVQDGSTNENFGAITTSGTYTFYGKANNSTLVIGRRSGGTAFDSYVDNVSVKEVGQNWTFGTDWSMGDSKVVGDSVSTQFLTQSFTFVSGKKYRTTCTVTGTDTLNNNNSFRLPYDGDVSNIAYVTKGVDGIYTHEFVSTGSSILYIGYIDSGTFTGSIDNISVIEITDDTDLPRINYTNFDYEDILGNELVTNGDFATDSDWAKGTGWSIANGEAILTNGNGSLSKSDGILEVGKTYEFSIEITSISLGAFSPKTNTGQNIFDSVTLNTVGVHTSTFTVTSGINLQIRASGTTTGSIDNVSVKELTEDVVVPYSGEGSLLLEPQSTNLITYSEDFTNSYWSHNADVTITNSSELAPNGKLDAKLIEYDGSGYSFIRAARGSTYTTSTLSVFAKKGNWRYLGLRNFQNDGNDHTVFDFDTETFSNINAGQSASFEIFSNGWYRIIVTQPSPSSSPFIGFSITNSTGSELNTTGGQVANVHLFGAQLEELSYATSYIPTEGSTVTRLADLCNNAGSSDLINSTEGVLYAEGYFQQTGSVNGLFAISDGSFNNLLMVRFGPIHKLQVEGTGGVNIIEPNTRASGTYKIAAKYDSNGVQLWVDGYKIVETSTQTTMSGVNQLMVGKSPYGNIVGYKNKCVALFKEALSNDQLERLTGEGYETFNLLAQANNYTII